MTVTDIFDNVFANVSAVLYPLGRGTFVSVTDLPRVVTRHRREGYCAGRDITDDAISGKFESSGEQSNFKYPKERG